LRAALRDLVPLIRFTGGTALAPRAGMKRVALVWALTAVVGCADSDSELFTDGDAVKSEDGKADTSALAVFVDADFDAELVTDFVWDETSAVQDQLLFTVGQLNGMNAVGRVDKAVITNVVRTETEDGLTRLSYHAQLPIAWGNGPRNVPASIQLKLPRDISFVGQDAFTEKYKANCVDAGAHDVDSGSMFYYFRPANRACRIAAEDVSLATATLAPSPTQSTGKFPEYDKVWEDNRLEVLAIFGKYEDGATTASDAGVAAYNTFVSSITSELRTRNLVTIPATVPARPGVDAPDIELTATLPDGKVIHVVALLTDNVSTGLSEPAFRDRYETLSTRADLIVYSGHAGLGTNVRALARAGQWVTGQYAIVYLNGCDTFAYVDDALFTAHQEINPDDTTGFKYIDIVNNAMPAFFHSMSGATMAMIRGLIAYQTPQTYEQIFRRIDSVQVVLVSGEQDNAFTPGAGGAPVLWNGLVDSGAVRRDEVLRWETPVLAAGRYELAITGAGDADLYVRIGNAPTTSAFDCRPFKRNSSESCTVDLAQPAPLHVMVRGNARQSSRFELVGRPL
jgi:hypothetical protein